MDSFHRYKQGNNDYRVCASVVTAEDVPGLNLFGIAFPHQPVFCHDRVRYIGDALASVAADTEEIAEYALSLIEVVYEPLPLVDDPETALEAGTIMLHPEGNLLHQTTLQHGDTDINDVSKHVRTSLRRRI